MKKIVGLLMVFCLVLSAASGVLAATKPEISEQPVSATTTQNGTVSFSVKVKTNGTNVAYTWYFVNPATGEKVSGRKLNTVIKGVKVTRPNGQKITLKKVPESMHGWNVYCHIAGNGYKLDSDQVVLSVYGMESVEPAPQEQPAEEPVPEQPAEETVPEQPAEEPVPEQPAEETVPEQPADEPVPEQPVDEPAPEQSAEHLAEEPVPEQPAEEQPVIGDNGEIVEADREITVTASGAYLYRVDALGNPVDESPAEALTFLNIGNVAIRSEDPIKSWSINGILIEPIEPVKGFNLVNVAEDVSIGLNVVKAAAPVVAEVDESSMCQIACEGCTFTCFAANLIGVTEGSVPAGSLISVSAAAGASTANGYSVNGADPEYQNLAFFTLTVTGDTSISLK